MLRQPRSRRMCSALFGVWFLLFGVLPGSLRPCPMHARSAMPMPTAEAMSMAGHAHHAPTDATPPDSAPAPSESCDCVAPCCGTPSMALARPPEVVAARVVLGVRDTVARGTTSPDPSDVRLLPYANGPPGSLTG
jgi:hypothetical protein